jgi:hypothetical protein
LEAQVFVIQAVAKAKTVAKQLTFIVRVIVRLLLSPDAG